MVSMLERKAKIGCNNPGVSQGIAGIMIKKQQPAGKKWPSPEASNRNLHLREISVLAAARRAGFDHGRIALNPRGLQSLVVLVPQAVLLSPHGVEVVPGENATFVTIGEHRFDRVIANGFQLDHIDFTLAGLQDFLPR